MVGRAFSHLPMRFSQEDVFKQQHAHLLPSCLKTLACMLIMSSTLLQALKCTHLCAYRPPLSVHIHLYVAFVAQRPRDMKVRPGKGSR